MDESTMGHIQSNLHWLRNIQLKNYIFVAISLPILQKIMQSKKFQQKLFLRITETKIDPFLEQSEWNNQLALS